VSVIESMLRAGLVQCDNDSNNNEQNNSKEDKQEDELVGDEKVKFFLFNCYIIFSFVLNEIIFKKGEIKIIE